MRKQNIEYMRIISQVRQLVKDKKNIEFTIADLAMKACTIRHGGISSDLYTMTDFCNDTDLSRKSVSRWIQHRKIDLTLKKNKKKASPPEVKKIAKILSKDSKLGTDGQSKYEDISRIELAQKRASDGMTTIFIQNRNRLSRALTDVRMYNYEFKYRQDLDDLKRLALKIIEVIDEKKEKQAC